MLEQSILCELKTFTKALFVWFATHYIFNLEYDHHIKETALFYQEYLFGEPDTCIKSSTYLSVSTDIKKIARS